MSLTQTAYTSRRIIKYGGIGMVVFSILWSVSVLAYKAWLAAHPPYVAPTVKYGILARLVFPERNIPSNKNFTLELANDAMPKFSDQAKVYVIYHPNTTFLALEEDKKVAAAFGFTNEPTEIETGVYKFINNKENKTLVINVTTGDFTITYPYTSDQMLLTPDKMPSKTEALATAVSFLQTGGKYTTDLENGVKEISFWKIEGDGLKSVSSQSEANAARVDFYRQKLDDKSVLSSNFGQASVSILVSGSTVSAKKIIGVNFKDMRINQASYSTYPIKTSQEIVNSLNSGNYWIAKDATSNNVIVRKVYLAYFEPINLTNYLQPIFVAEGDNNFVAYIPAISSNYIKPEIKTATNSATTKAE
jgi:hypothetical protein